VYTTLTYDEFVDTYKPIKNHLTKYDQNTFETYGEEVDFVLAQDEKFVWTEVDGDGGCYIINGLHLVNRIHYYVCEVPSALPTYQEVVVNLYKDCDTCGCSGGYGTTDDGADCPECSVDTDGFTIYPDTREQLIEIFGEEYANEQV
jgi:hypothetical protein